MKYLAWLMLFVCLSAFAQTDGPATLPQKAVETRASFTPSSNYPKHVGPADSLVSALAAALPGDTIVVDPTNVTNVSGFLTLPSGTATQWITIKTASSLIPDEYTQIQPSFAAQLPKINLTSASASIIGGQYVRLIGFEVSRPAGTGIVYNLFRQLGHDVILDRIYAHGTANDETNRGVFLSNAYNVAVVNSYFADFKCMAAVGACGDSQAIAGGASTTQDGNYVIRNNFLQAAGEGILIGGGPASQTPCDMTVQYNQFDKPLAWNPKDPSYAPSTGKDGLPHPWIVKNNFELKNGCRVLFEGNILGPTWGGFTQVGASVLLTAKNAGSAAAPNGCPTCQVTDVTIRYNHLSYESQSFQLGCAKSDFGMWPADCGRYSIHDNLVDHLQYPTCSQCGSFTVLIGGGNPAGGVNIHDVSFVNNTLITDGWITFSNSPGNGAASNAASAVVASTPPAGSPNIHFDNNVFDPGYYGIYSAGGGALNCWSSPGTLQQHVAQCWNGGGSMVGNQFTVTVPFKGYLPWPVGNGTNPTAGANLAAVNAAVGQRH